MRLVNMITQLDAFRCEYGISNMTGEDFDCAPVRKLCAELEKEFPELHCDFVLDDTDHMLMVSVSAFLNRILMEKS